MGLAVTSGLDKVVTPFVNKGIPVEYELIRSIMTVADKQRPKVGIVNTGINIMNPDGSQRGEWPLITELRKQYEVVSVDASQPIRGNYDVLLAVQPSMLSPDAFDHFVDAVRSGIPTAVLEDPFPYFYPASMPGTGEPKQSAMGGHGRHVRRRPEPSRRATSTNSGGCWGFASIRWKSSGKTTPPKRASARCKIRSGSSSTRTTATRRRSTRISTSPPASISCWCFTPAPSRGSTTRS